LFLSFVFQLEFMFHTRLFKILNREVSLYPVVNADYINTTSNITRGTRRGTIYCYLKLYKTITQIFLKLIKMSIYVFVYIYLSYL